MSSTHKLSLGGVESQPWMPSQRFFSIESSYVTVLAMHRQRGEAGVLTDLFVCAYFGEVSLDASNSSLATGLGTGPRCHVAPNSGKTLVSLTLTQLFPKITRQQGPALRRGVNEARYVLRRRRHRRRRRSPPGLSPRDFKTAVSQLTGLDTQPTRRATRF